MCPKTNRNFRSGAVLLVVLIIIMVITVLSLGFLSRSDVELACGRNMVLRERMDYMAESGLEHAKGLILNPQDIEDEYFTGATGLQLDDSSNDYYDLVVEPNLTDHCNYIIDSNAYEIRDGQKVGQSNLRALLRLDPCIALWTGNDLTLHDSVTIYGDVYCDGVLINQGTIEGDVFADSFSGTSTGQLYNKSDLSLEWPGITVNGFEDKPGVTYYFGNSTLSGDIEGMLLVNGDLYVQEDLNLTITASKNMPALYVTGDLSIGKNSTLNINGLAAVDGYVFLCNNADINEQGALFTGDGIFEIASDISGNNAYALLYNGPEWTTGKVNEGLRFDGTNDKIENYSMPGNINGLSEITLSLWVKSDVANQDRDILFTRNPTGADEELGIRYDRSGAYGGGYNCIKASIRTTFGYTQIESSSGTQTTSWQHLALTWKNDVNDSRLKLYIDGVQNTLKYDRCPVYGTITGIQKLMLGCGTKDQYWDGLIDEVRIYSRALNAAEINQVKNGGVVSDLILYWDFDQTGSDINITAAPEKAAVNIYTQYGSIEKWGQAAGAFYKSIERR